MWTTLGVIITVLFLARLIRDKPLKRPTPRLRNADLVKVILSLEQETLDDLFRLYAEEFGPGAARYARRTYDKWRTGEVRPSSQTFNRLLVRLPNVMSFDLKCEVLRKLREEYCSKDNYRLTVDTRSWKDALAPLVTDIIDKSYTAELPEHLGRRLRWLSADDMQIARAIVAESQAQESRNAISLLQQEFDNIERLLDTARGRSRITHTIKLPFGTIRLKIKRG